MALTIYYPGQKEETDVLNCKSRSEVCRVPEKSHSMKMHGLCDHSVLKKNHLFGSCSKLTNIYIETITRILDTSLYFNYCTYYRMDLNERYRVYIVHQSNNTDKAKWKIHGHSKKVISYACKFMKHNINKGLRSEEGICLHPLQGHGMGIYNLSMLKTVCVWWRITSYTRWPCWLTQHGGSRGGNLKKKKNPPVQGVQYHAEGLQMHLQCRVRNQEQGSHDLASDCRAQSTHLKA
jgi:hypothetical protein